MWNLLPFRLVCEEYFRFAAINDGDADDGEEGGSHANVGHFDEMRMPVVHALPRDKPSKNFSETKHLPPTTRHKIVVVRPPHPPPSLSHFIPLFLVCACVFMCCVKRHQRMKWTKQQQRQHKKWLMIYVTLAFWQSQLFALREKTSFSFVVYTRFSFFFFLLVLARRRWRCRCRHCSRALAQSPIHPFPSLDAHSITDCYFHSSIVCSKRWCKHETVSAHIQSTRYRARERQRHQLEKKSWKAGKRRKKMAHAARHNVIRRLAIFRSLAAFHMRALKSNCYFCPPVFFFSDSAFHLRNSLWDW